MIKLATRPETLRPIFEKDFDSLLPEKERSHIFVDEEGAMVTVELLLRANMWWVAPEHRGKAKAGVLLRRMIRCLLNTIPKGSSVVVVASSASQEKLCRKVGMTEVEGTMFRFDL